MKFLTSIDLSQNEIQNAIMQPLAAPPANPKIGQIYFNSIDLTLYLWTGEKWIPVPTKTSQLENDSGFITSYNKIVVFIDRSPAGCYNNYRVLWIGLYHLPSNGFAEAPTTASLLKC